jgi:hypothetical protein
MGLCSDRSAWGRRRASSARRTCGCDSDRAPLPRLGPIARCGSRSGSEPDPEPLRVEQPGLVACYEASARGISVSGERAGQPALRLVVGQGLAPGSLPRERAELANPAAAVAEALGISVYARQLVDGCDRRQLERLCRYIARPPLALERRSRRADGRLELELKSVWKDGTRTAVPEPHDLLVRLCADVPAPRLHLLRYFGVLSSHHTLRREVMPAPAPEPGARAN